MKLFTVLAVSFVLVAPGLAQEDLFSALPECSVKCFQETVGLSSCDPTDFACLCVDESFLGATQLCQGLNCTVPEILTSTNATLAACGVTPKDQSATIIAIPAAFGSFALLLVVFRLCGRLWITKVDLGWDDYLITAAMVVASFLNALCYPMAHFGMGRDFWTIPHENIDTTLMILYMAMIPYMVAEMLAQLSLLAFYFRVFQDGPSFVRNGSLTLTGLSICFGIANTFTMMFQCTPISFFWTSWAGETTGTCININLYSWIRAATQIALDLAILSLPLPGVIRLQMDWRKKAQVLIMFAMGFLITIISILRLQSLIQFAKTSNPTYDNSPAVYWSVLECNMFIICACLPSVRSILSKLVPGIFGTAFMHSYAPDSKKYVRQEESAGRIRHLDPHELQHFDRSSNIMKSVDVDVLSEERSASREELVYPSRRYNIYGA